MLKQLTVILILASVFLVSCGSLPLKGTAKHSEALSAFFVGTAALQVGDDQRAEEDLDRAASLAPSEPAVFNNLGVMFLRRRDSPNATKNLEKAMSLDGTDARIPLNLALGQLQAGDSKAAIKSLEAAIKLDPKNLKPAYLLAEEAEKAGNDKDALARFQSILKTAPGNVAAQIEVARLSAKIGDADSFSTTLSDLRKNSEKWPDDAKEQFGKLQSAGIDNAGTELAFLRNLLLTVPEFRSSIDSIKPSDTVVGDIIMRPVKLESPDFAPAEPDLSISFDAGKVSDAQSKGAVFFFSDGDSSPQLLYFGDFGVLVGKDGGAVSSEAAYSVSSLDFDYDFKNDIALATESGVRLFKQGENGKFADVTASAGINETGRITFVGAFDFDNEGDLDVFVAPDTGSAYMLRNNGNGTFEKTESFAGAVEVVAAEFADLDEDGDSDCFVLDRKGNVYEYTNERGGLFLRREKALAASIAGIGIGDTNGDGILDLNMIDQNGRLTALSMDGKLRPVETDTGLKCGDGCRIQIGDLDNNGANDIVAASNDSSTLLMGSLGGKFQKASTTPKGAILDLADIDKNGKLDLSGIDQNGAPAIFTNKSQKNYHWQVFRPKAAKTEGDQRVNTFGIGGEIEARSGLLVQKQLINSPQVHFGLGTSEKIDVARVVWQNGYVQAEFDLKPDQNLLAEQRLKGSCPHLFAWNGNEFAHVKDAPPWSPALGLKINAQDTYGILQTEEWFKIPGEALVPLDGKYEIRITGEYWETYYIDHFRLLAVDHPKGTEIFTDERFSIPLPPLKVFTTGELNPLVSAVDHNGNDVAEIVSKVDEKYLDGIKRGKYQGVAEDHFVEIELPKDAPIDGKLWIVGEGWMHPTDASINVQRGQDAKGPPKSMSIETLSKDGTWIPFKENLGFPAGKMKSVLFDIEHAFDKNPESRKIRIRTELEVFWDRISWAVAKDGKTNRTHDLNLSEASLRYRGFSVINKADDSSPEVPDYSKIMATSQRWRDLEGFYTRFGDILELLQKTDDRYVLSGAGDELVLSFPSLPAPEEGFERDFVIIGNGWIKDGDLNSVFSKTVLPLPTHATNDYSTPPGKLEDDPVYKLHRDDWLKFHTRYVTPDNFRSAVRDVR